MQTMSSILSLAIWLPVAFGVLLLAVGRQENAGVTRRSEEHTSELQSH